MRLALVAVLAAGCGRFGFAFIDGGASDGGDDGARKTDASSDATTAANFVFITSTLPAPGSLGGLTGADAFCNQTAMNAGLAGSYVAWLSTATVNAKDRLAGSRGWRRTDGKPFADTVADLTAGKMFYPIDRDETGARVVNSQDIATSTILAGTYKAGTDCTAYTSLTGDASGGEVGVAGSGWTQYAIFSGGCASGLRLYCFGVGHNVAVSPPAPTTRRAFWLGSTWTNTSGLSGADSACQTAATSASLGGTFKALLASGNASAISRFNTSGPVWQRLDGVELADSMAGFLAGDLVAPLDRGPSGYAPFGDLAWVGGSGPNAISVAGASATTCNDWTVGGTSGDLTVVSTYGSAGVWFGSGNPCTLSASLFCFEP